METFTHRAEHKTVHVEAIAALGTSDQSQQGDGDDQNEYPDNKGDNNSLPRLRGL